MVVRRTDTGTSVPYELRDLAEAICHPVRGRVMAALYERRGATVRQVADRLREPTRRIRHQIDVLTATGLVEVTGENLRRGVVERRYGMAVPIEIDDHEGLSENMQARMAAAVVKLLLGDVAEAARAGTFGRRRDRCEVRSYAEVDEACVEELAKIHLQAYRDVEATLNAGKERIRKSGQPGTEVVSAIFFFEAPLWASSADDGAPIVD